MKKVMKKIVLFIVIISLFITSLLSFSTSAANLSDDESNIIPVVGVYDYSQVSSASSNDTYYLGSCTSGIFTYKVNRYYGNWYAIFNLDLSHPCYKGSTALTITQTIARTYSSQTTFEFSASIGGTASAEIISLTASLTGTVSSTMGVSFEISSSVSYNIASTDSSGYYKIGVCHDIYRHKVEKYNGTTKLYEYDMPTPRGTAYYALLYSTDSSSGYSRF